MATFIPQRGFFTPAPTPISGGQFIIGFGPALLLPTGTETLLSGDKWGAGPTFVGAFLMDSGLTASVLTNHIWSYAGDGSKISQTYVQPGISYTTTEAWTFSASSELTYNWLSDEWVGPVSFGASKLLQIGTQPVSIGAKARHYIATTDNSPHGWAVQGTLTFLFPSGSK